MTPSLNVSPTRLKEEVVARARSLGFNSVRVAAAFENEDASAHLDAFVADGRHGDMAWLLDTVARRRDPRALMATARSVIMVGLSYAPDRDPLEALKDKGRGVISVYAKGRDYHGIIKGRLKQVAGLLHARSGGDVKVFVDTAPLMEKPLAAAAGIGWQGKHTNLVSKEFGSWLFLGAILTSIELPADEAEGDHCGTCRACLDICPTNAFPAPYQLDARRCIAYLTNEHRGHIAVEFRDAIGNRVFGCDDCLAACPWNKFAQATFEVRLMGGVETDNPPLGDLLALDDRAFRKRFAGTPVKRLGRDRFVRNVLIAAGNSGDGALVPLIETLLKDASTLVRAMAVWAIGKLCNGSRVKVLKARHLAVEDDGDVRNEWASLEDFGISEQPGGPI